MTLPRRTLCGAVDIKGWSGRLIPEQIRAQQSLVTVVHAACQKAGLPEEIVQHSGDGVLIMPPSGIDESAVIPELVHGLHVALRQENRLLSDAAQIRLRFALTSGLVAAGSAGFNGPAVIECFRLLDSDPVKDALVDHPRADLAVIVSDYLFHDVVQHEISGDLRAKDFWSVKVDIQKKNFAAEAWVWVSTRNPDLPAPPPPGGPAADEAAPELPGEIAEARALVDQERSREALGVLDGLSPDGEAATAVTAAVLDVRADALIATGEHGKAIKVLEELLEIEPEPSASALLRLGRCHAAVGHTQVARQTFEYLKDLAPLRPESYLELGRLDRRAGNVPVARANFAEAARRLAPEGLVADLIDELLELPR